MNRTAFIILVFCIFFQAFETKAQTDTIAADTLATDTIVTDTVTADTIFADTTAADTTVKKTPAGRGQARIIDSLAPEIDSSKVVYFRYSLDSLSLQNLHPIDTSLIDFEHYNPAFQRGEYYATLGNLGLAVNRMTFNPLTKTGFNYGLRAFDPFMYQIEDVKYFELYKPYTHLKYTMGTRKEQLFRATHSQNPIKNLNMGFDFRFIYSEGYFLRQLADDKSFYGYLKYQTTNKRYGATGTYLHNKIVAEENGGLANDSAFIRNEETDYMLYNVRLNRAENTVKKSGIQFNQYFNLSTPPKPANDTLSKEKKVLKINLGRLSHRFYWVRDQYLFRDAVSDSAFYRSFGLEPDTVDIFDSTWITRMINEIHWSNLSYDDKPGDKPFYIKLGLKHQQIRIGRDSTEIRNFSQIIPSGQLSFFILKSFRLNAEYDFVIGEYNGGDFSFRANVNQYIGTEEKNKGLISIRANYSHVTPGWFYQQRDSQYFNWDNDFDKQQNLIGSMDYKYKDLQAGVTYNLIKNYTYLDENAESRQFGESFSVIQAFLRKDFRIWNLGIDNTIIFQTSSKKDILHLPDFIAHVNIYYTQELFRGATTIHPGIEAFYNTAYYADAYMPVLKSFYLQDEMKLGNYAYIDVYLTIKIKRARIFLKYAHANAGLMGYDYFMVPNYPQKDGSFKLGLSWMFYD